MTEQEITTLLMPVFGELDEDFHSLLARRPLLAHYTSIDVLEKIMKDEELWLSNPLFMNDLEELRFGIFEGARQIEQSDAVKKLCGSQARIDILKNAFISYYSQFDREHALDVYLFCLSEHEPSNMDGLLSMWRGYGGSGNGAALVFNTGFVTGKAGSPLIVTKVHYASRERRIAWLQQKLEQFTELLAASTVPDEKLHVVAYHVFSLIKFFALKFKHDGFHEEREWRIIYMPDRDVQVLLKDKFGYVIGRRGVEPKLKLKIEPLRLEPRETWTFADILERIILGPSVSSPLAKHSVERMLTTMGKDNFRQKVVASSIPLRPAY